MEAFISENIPVLTLFYLFWNAQMGLHAADNLDPCLSLFTCNSQPEFPPKIYMSPCIGSDSDQSKEFQWGLPQRHPLKHPIFVPGLTSSCHAFLKTDFVDPHGVKMVAVPL